MKRKQRWRTERQCAVQWKQREKEDREERERFGVYLENKPGCAERAKKLISGARARSRLKGIRFTLDNERSRMNVQRVLELGKCELSGIEFGTGAFAPTLDRIEPSLGYIPGNVRVVCRLMNFALGTWGEDTLRQVMSVWLPTPPNRRPYDVSDEIFN